MIIEYPNGDENSCQRKYDDDEPWMVRCLELAQSASNIGEVPIGCIVVYNNNEISNGVNALETQQDPTAHAEIIAIRAAAKVLGSRRLLDCTLYVTLEPCSMCAGAILNARIPRVVFGALDSKAGAVVSLYSMIQDSRLNHRAEFRGGVLADESAQLLQEFFQSLRTRNKSRKYSP